MDPLGTPVTEYYHADMLGSTRIMTDGAGNGLGEAYYTAFGQLQFASTPHRYGYLGEHGYQADASDGVAGGFPFLHVGHRYYDPATGRFLQRDPIGIDGGLNVYEYIGSSPTEAVDPSGLIPCPACEANFYRKNPGVVDAEVEAAPYVIAACLFGPPAVIAARAAVVPAVRWLNRGQLRIGVSGPKRGKYYFSVRWKNKHFDLFEVGG